MKMTGKDDEDWFLFVGGSWIFVTRCARFDDEKRRLTPQLISTLKKIGWVREVPVAKCTENSGLLWFILAYLGKKVICVYTTHLLGEISGRTTLIQLQHTTMYPPMYPCYNVTTKKAQQLRLVTADHYGKVNNTLLIQRERNTSSWSNSGFLDPHPISLPLSVCEKNGPRGGQHLRLLKTYYDATAETPADVLHPTLSLGSKEGTTRNCLCNELFFLFLEGKMGGCWGYIQFSDVFFGLKGLVNVEMFFFFFWGGDFLKKCTLCGRHQCFLGWPLCLIFDPFVLSWGVCGSYWKFIKENTSLSYGALFCHHTQLTSVTELGVLDFEVGGTKMFFLRMERNLSKMHDAESLSHTFSDLASIHMGVWFVCSLLLAHRKLPTKSRKTVPGRQGNLKKQLEEYLEDHPM